MTLNMNNLDKESMDILRTSINNSDIAKMAKKERPKKKTKSYKPLKFEVRENDSPIKRAIIEQINSRDLVYDDLKEYYSKVFGDDYKVPGPYNIMETLRNRNGMKDKSISLLLDFLEMDILFVNRNADTVLASANDLISRLQSCPERLPEIIDLLKEEVGKNE